MEVGHLLVHEGWLVACDPGLFSRESKYAARRPRSRRVPTGRHSVRAILVGDTRAVGVWFNDKPVETLELVMLEGETSRDYVYGDRSAYVVDCGLGCIMDTTAAKALEQRDLRERDADWLIGLLGRSGLDEQ